MGNVDLDMASVCHDLKLLLGHPYSAVRNRRGRCISSEQHMDPYTEAVIWYKHTLSFVRVGTILHHLVDSSLSIPEHHKYLSVF